MGDVSHVVRKRRLKSRQLMLQHEEIQEYMAHLDSELASVLHMADEAILVVDESLCITVANRGAEKVFGYEAGELIDKPLAVLLPQRFVEAHKKHMQRYAAASGVFHTMGAHREVTGLRKDGAEFPAEASLSHFLRDGHALFAVILRDITERKEGRTPNS